VSQPKRPCVTVKRAFYKYYSLPGNYSVVLVLFVARAYRCRRNSATCHHTIPIETTKFYENILNTPTMYMLPRTTMSEIHRTRDRRWETRNEMYADVVPRPYRSRYVAHTEIMGALHKEQRYRRGYLFSPFATHHQPATSKNINFLSCTTYIIKLQNSL